MQREEKKTVPVRSVFRAYGKAALRHPWALAFAGTGVFVVQAGSVISPLFLKEFVNALAVPGIATGALFSILGFYAGALILGWIGQRIRLAGSNHLEARVIEDLYNDAFSYLIGHSHEFFISNFTGTLTRRVTRYARAFEQIFDNLVFNIAPTTIFAISVIAILWQRSIYLGAALFVWTTLFVYIQYRVVVYQQPLRTARVAADSASTGALSDAVLNHSAIAAFAAEERERRLFAGTILTWRKTTERVWNASAWVVAVQGALALMIELALLGGAVFLWERGIVTIGDFVLIQVYVLGLLNQVWSIGNNMRQLHDAFSDAGEMLDIMELPHEIRDVAGAKPLRVTEGAIDFADVRFAYASGASVLGGFVLSIAPHEKVAFVGASGAGKSTLAKLLLRLYEVSSGAIRIDGQDIAFVTQESLRSSLSFVPQEPVLFHRTIKDNIRYGRPDATDEEVIEAAKQAHCHEFIKNYPEGYETLVGERGVKLSGGERQRVAIARAILKDAPILILDEATSSLDSESEALIQDAFTHLMKGKTVIAIAHRLSTIMKMDRIVVIEQGRVALTGSHAELLGHQSNLYKKLWEIQAGGFLSGVELPG